MAACPHGEDTSYCVECLEGPPPERPAPRWVLHDRPFVARFDGFCRVCSSSWEPGDLIRGADQVERLAGGGTRIIDTRYVHDGCA